MTNIIGIVLLVITVIIVVMVLGFILNLTFELMGLALFSAIEYFFWRKETVKYGVAANGRRGRWYVEVESQHDEQNDTEQYALEIQADAKISLGGEGHFSAVDDAVKDIDELIAALQQAREQLTS